jgi:hypothetical protein
LPPATDAFFTRAFAAAVDDRFPTARAFADAFSAIAFSAIASGTAPPVLAPSPPPPVEAPPAAAHLFAMGEPPKPPPQAFPMAPPLPSATPDGRDEAPWAPPPDAALLDEPGRYNLRRRLVPGELSASDVQRVMAAFPPGARSSAPAKRKPLRSRASMAAVAFVIVLCTGALSATALRFAASHLAPFLPLPAARH